MIDQAFPRGKRKSTNATPTTTTTSTTNEKDFLFGSISSNNNQPPSKKSKSKPSTDHAISISALPLGGGAVLPPSSSSGGRTIPAKIELLTFGKLARGMKVLGVVREVTTEYAVIALPTMLTGFVRREENGPPLTTVMPPPNTIMSFAITSTAIDDVKGHKKRRIELSPLPKDVNVGFRLDDFLSSKTNKQDDETNAIIVRGRVVSLEDHGCLVDIGMGNKNAFLKFDAVGDEYEVMENIMNLDEDDCDMGKQAGVKGSDSNKILINEGRIHDFMLSTTQNGPILQLSLPSIHKLSRVCLADNITPTISSLQPGMLAEVKVEQYAKNGMCVNFMGGLYRGSIDEDHLGGWRNTTAENKGDGMWWKSVFRGRNGKFAARIIAVDTVTKIIRFSLNPHILALRGEYASFPNPVGTIIENAHVIRVDPGVGALLALPSSDIDEENQLDMTKNILQLDKDLSNNLYNIPEYKAASRVRTAYVHISKSIDCNDSSSAKKRKDNKTVLNRTPEALFARHFSLNTKIKALRILSTSHLIDGIASCATAKSIVDAHVLTHEDVIPGAIYRNVPVIQMLDGGGVLVDLGVGTKGIIPASHLFDKASHGSLDTGGDMVLSGYRQKIRSAKYKKGSLVDVRCLTCDPITKQCVLTSKKTLLSTDIESPIVDYAPPSMEIGRVAAGFISRVDENGITVTFYNNVHGRVSSRALAAELGVEDPRLNYFMGDVVAARVVDCQRRRNRNVVNDNQGNLYYYHLTLSLKTTNEKKCNTLPMQVDDRNNRGFSGQVPLVAGSVLEAKTAKVLQLVNCLNRDDGMFLTGYAVVAIKSKFFSDSSHHGESVDFKLPYDHLLDTFGDDISNPPVELDAIAAKYLTVGKKIDAEALILSVPKGIDTLPILTLRSSLIDTIKKSSCTDEEESITCPSPTSNIFMGEYVRGYICRIDERFGAFVRFLDGLTGLIPKLKKGLDERLYDSILCKVTALDITSSPPKILLKKVKEGEVITKRRKVEYKSVNSKDLVQVNDVVDIKIADINFARANVYIIGKSDEAKSRARIHVTMADPISTKQKLSKKEKQSKEETKISKNHPFYKWKVGDVIKDVRCVAVDFRDGINYVELSNRKSDCGHPSVLVTDPNHLPSGSIVSAIVTSISSSTARCGIYVQLCPGIAGFVPALEASDNPEVLNNLSSHFIVGSRISVCVVDKKSTLNVPKIHRMQDQHGDHVIELSILLAGSGDAINPSKPKRGDMIVGCISKKRHMQGPPSLMISLRGGFVGRCCITELADVEEWINMPLGKTSSFQTKKNPNNQKQHDQRVVSDSDDHDNNVEETALNSRDDESEYPEGRYVKCRALGNVKSKNQMLELSLRESRLNGNMEDDALPTEGETVHGFVVSTTKVGCFVRLSRSVEGRVVLKELSDDFIPRPDEMFPMGRLVVGKVKSVKELEPTKRSNLSATVDIDMRESVLLTSGKRLTLDDIELKSKYTGVVTRVETYGVFVRIDNSEISGLAHVSECSDTYVKNVFDLYNPGDMVKLLVIKCDEDKQRLGFSLKASNFVDDDDSEEETSDEEEESSKEKMYVMSSDNESSSEKESDQSIDSDDENYVAKMASKMETHDNTEDESDTGSESDGNSEEDSESESNEPGQSIVDAMDTNVGFEWDTSAKPSAKIKSTEESADESDSSSSTDSSDGDNDDADVGFKSSHKSRKKAAARRKEEEEISRREVALADGTADDNPETTADFERLVASSPNNSETWIKYMAFHLSLADIESARSVANRAFDRIQFRQEGEKLNVWTALLTLELKFGNDASLQETADRACQHNNPKQVYLRVCELLEKEVDAAAGATGFHDVTTTTQRADKMFTRMCKKFKSKKTVWIAHFRYLLKCSRHEEAHDLLKRSHQSLPKYKHVETMSKFAQMEFELGSPERGRTIFSALLEKHPKRMDLLFVNIDKEVKNGDISKARALFDSVVNPVSDERKQKFKFSDKQMKSLFKKWYRMEDEFGDEEMQERVKDEARAYVAKAKVQSNE